MKDKLVTWNFIAILAANFLLYFGFYLLMPILPFYLSEVFHTTNGTIGIILSCYTLAALCIRPFSGYLLDTFARKPLYLLAYFLFTVSFAGYLVAGTLTLFTLIRIAHGVSFGTVTVGGNTVVIDIMPSSRRGEGLGYYGLMNNTAMSIGPMVGLFLHDKYSFEMIFWCAMISCFIGFILASCVKTPPKAPMAKEAISLDRFILLKGIPAGFCLLLLSIPYGMTSNYIAVYAKQIGITIDSGFFFTFMAFGMATSRLFSGRLVDKGKITQVINIGLYIVCLCFLGISACGWINDTSINYATILFFANALLLGIGFGIMFPAFNTLFINLAPNNKRGTATSTYLTSWDIGIGGGMLLGGFMAQIASFRMAYLLGDILAIAATIMFRVKVAPHFLRNKLR